MTYKINLDSPVIDVEYTFKTKPPTWQIVTVIGAWMMLWLTLSALIIWVYAEWFASLVGFSQALLVGIAILILTVMGDG